MYKEVAKLVLYRDLGEDSILYRIAEIIKDFDHKSEPNDRLVTRIYAEMKKLLDISTLYGFDHNLWQNYLTFLLITNENSFSITCEKSRRE